METLDQDYKKEQSTTFAVTADMARQYKALQDDLIHKINSLETTLTEQKEESAGATQRLPRESSPTSRSADFEVCFQWPAMVRRVVGH